MVHHQQQTHDVTVVDDGENDDNNNNHFHGRRRTTTHIGGGGTSSVDDEDEHDVSVTTRERRRQHHQRNNDDQHNIGLLNGMIVLNAQLTIQRYYQNHKRLFYVSLLLAIPLWMIFDGVLIQDQDWGLILMILSLMVVMAIRSKYGLDDTTSGCSLCCCCETSNEFRFETEQGRRVKCVEFYSQSKRNIIKNTHNGYKGRDVHDSAVPNWMLVSFYSGHVAMWDDVVSRSSVVDHLNEGEIEARQRRRSPSSSTPSSSSPSSPSPDPLFMVKVSKHDSPVRCARFLPSPPPPSVAAQPSSEQVHHHHQVVSFVTISDDRCIRIYEYNNNQQLQQPQQQPSDTVRCICEMENAHDDYIRDVQVVVLDNTTSTTTTTPTTSRQNFRQKQRQTLLLTCSDDTTIKLWKLQQQQLENVSSTTPDQSPQVQVCLLCTYRGHCNYVMKIDVCPLLENYYPKNYLLLFATASLDSTIMFWKLQPQSQPSSSSSCHEQQNNLIHHDVEHPSTGSGGLLHNSPALSQFSDTSSTQPLLLEHRHQHPTEQTLQATLSSFLEVPTTIQQPEFTLCGHEDGVNCINFHYSKPLLLSCSDDLTIKLWDYQQRVLLRTFGGGGNGGGNGVHTHNINDVQFLNTTTTTTTTTQTTISNNIIFDADNKVIFASVSENDEICAIWDISLESECDTNDEGDAAVTSNSYRSSMDDIQPIKKFSYFMGRIWSISWCVVVYNNNDSGDYYDYYDDDHGAPLPRTTTTTTTITTADVGGSAMSSGVDSDDLVEDHSSNHHHQLRCIRRGKDNDIFLAMGTDQGVLCLGVDFEVSSLSSSSSRRTSSSPSATTTTAKIKTIGKFTLPQS